MDQSLNNFKIELEQISFSKNMNNRKIIIGRSKNGVVYHGEFQNKNYSIKKILFSDMDETKIKKEVYTKNKLSHPNLLKTIAWCEDSEGIYVLDEYLSSITLMDYLKTEIDLAAKIEILIKIAEVLDYLHQMTPPIIHNDINSQSILISNESKEMYLVDYILNDDKAPNSAIDPNSFPVIYAPEILNQIHFGHEHFEYSFMDNTSIQNKATDIFQFSMLIYEILSGQFPFNNEKIKENILIYVIKGGRPSLKFLGKEINKDFIKLILLCWNQNPESRPDILQVKKELIKLLQKARDGNIITRRQVKGTAEKNTTSLKSKTFDYKISSNEKDIKIPQIENEINYKKMRVQRTFKGHTNYATTILQLNDGNLAITSDNTIQILNSDNMMCLKTFCGHQDTISCIIQLMDGNLASGSKDSMIKIWDYQNSKCLSTFGPQEAAVKILIQSKNGNLVSGMKDNRIKILNIEDGSCIQIFEGTDVENTLIKLKNENLAFAVEDKTLKIIDNEGASVVRTLVGSSFYTTVTQLSDGNLAVGSLNGLIQVFNLESGKCVKNFNGDGSITKLIQLNNGNIVSLSLFSNNIKIWNYEKRNCVATLCGHSKSIKNIILLKDGNVASVSEDKTIKIWDVESQKCIRTLTGHNGWILGIIQLGNGNLVSSSIDKITKLWTINGSTTGCCIIF